ncbi:MAG: Nramp family divalent metal transporter, partial [Gemmatimonadetes bacterium]|nr:Nramp family divalent metal transporter [Gemmatimonadota bacterium]
GYGMGEKVGYISAAVGGTKLEMAHTGFMFDPTPEAMERWRGWWRIVRADQWGVYFIGAVLGMVLPAVLYVTFIEAGTDIRGLSVAAALADAMSSRAGAVFGGVVALMAVWVLFKTQLDIVDGTARAITDILWTGSARIRGWREGDVRVVYYGVLAAITVWGVIALRLAQPIVLLQLGANMAGIVFVVSGIHVLYINTTMLPEEIRPPLWRRVALVTMSVFYGAFVVMWLRGLAG